VPSTNHESGKAQTILFAQIIDRPFVYCSARRSFGASEGQNRLAVGGVSSSNLRRCCYGSESRQTGRKQSRKRISSENGGRVRANGRMCRDKAKGVRCQARAMEGYAYCYNHNPDTTIIQSSPMSGVATRAREASREDEGGPRGRGPKVYKTSTTCLPISPAG
jgi:hypothetical protein